MVGHLAYIHLHQNKKHKKLNFTRFLLAIHISFKHCYDDAHTCSTADWSRRRIVAKRLDGSTCHVVEPVAWVIKSHYFRYRQCLFQF